MRITATIGLTIAAYEGSYKVNAFTSKFDLARNDFTKEERRGLALFQGKGKCARCHTLNGQDPVFTDFTYDNLGIPANPDNPVYDNDSQPSLTLVSAVSWQVSDILRMSTRKNGVSSGFPPCATSTCGLPMIL